MKVNNVERWLRLFFGVVVLLFAGIIYAWAILKAPFASEFGWDPAQLSLNYTFTIMFFCVGSFLAGLLTKRTTPRLRILVSAALLFVGFFGTSRLTPGISIVWLYVFYGFASGLGVGLTYTTVIGLTNAWFPDKKGLCSGILLMGFGLTSLIIGNIADAMIKNANVGWSATFLSLAIALGAVLVLASFIIRGPGEDVIFPEPGSAKKTARKLPKKAAKKAAKAAQKAKKAAPAREFTASEMIRRPSFWLMFVFITLLASVGSAALALAADILQELNVQSPAAIIGVISIFNGLGRLCCGAMFDRLGLRKTQYFISATAILAPAVVVVSILASSLAVGLLGLALCYFSYGFAPTISSVFASNFYGMKNFSLNFSILTLILIPAPFAAVLGGSLYQSTGSFVTPFLILLGCSVAGLFINLAIREP
ncbi:MAG: MFS transporter [Peptococcaceae bacterium]|jgi:OFA family oxalate/formate antiporter-like MFS transporter|nr:MFS transporter [Peptococcaceae bacterium]